MPFSLLDVLMGRRPEVESPPAFRNMEVPPPELSAPEELHPDINRAARQFRLDPKLIDSMISTESSYNPKAKSGAGASGLMQLMPTTARMFGVTDLLDPQQNIMAGSAYLRNLMNQFGDLELALAAYNAGPTRVRRSGVPNIPETKNYLSRILGNGPFDVRQEK